MSGPELSKQLALHVEQLHFGGNWTCSNLRDQLQDVTWEEATAQVYGFNTIATLLHHINYYVAGVAKVLQGEPLSLKDELSFNHPPIESQSDWDRMRSKAWDDAKLFSSLIEQLPEKLLWEDFTDEKYGIYHRNLVGIIEHSHYHLGQIVLIKKLISKAQNS